MPISLRACVERAPVALAFAALLSLSLPGVEIARAESDLAPSAEQLFGLGPEPAPPAPPGTCQPVDPTQLRKQQQRDAELLARMYALAGGPGEGRVLNGRGLNYAPQRDVAQEMARIHAEAARAREARAAQ